MGLRGVVHDRDSETYANPTFTGTGGSGYPIILASSWAAVASTNVTTEEALVTIAIPAGAMGANGVIRGTVFFTAVNTANAKTARVRFGGIAGTIYVSLTLTSVGGISAATFIIGNRAATNSQTGGRIASNLGGTATADVGSQITSSVDTTAAVDLVFSSEKATGTEAMSVEGYTVELIKP